MSRGSNHGRFGDLNFCRQEDRGTRLWHEDPRNDCKQTATSESSLRQSLQLHVAAAAAARVARFTTAKLRSV